MIKNDLKQNLTIGLLIWLAGSTVVGIPIVYGIIGYRGFCFGYTLGSLIAVLGKGIGIKIAILGVFFQNLIFIPSIILIASSGMKLYKTIIKDRKKENIKIGIIKHSIISFFGIVGIFFSSAVEALISTNLLIWFSKFI